MLKKNILISVTVLLSFLSFIRCSGTPVPADKINYVGRWQSAEMTLAITQDGYVDYKRIGNGGKRSINAPIQKFVGHDFIVGVLGFNTTFAVTKPPYQDGGKWHMVVDGVLLTKVVY